MSTNLSMEHECPSHRSPHQGNCWQGCPCQSGTASGPLDGDIRRVSLWSPERMDPGGITLPGLKEWPEAEQELARGAAAQIGAPVCLH